MIVELIIVFVGLLLSIVLFYHLPVLIDHGNVGKPHQISVIIPARNEEHNLSLLLEDLINQTYPIHEIICVDDDSIDQTAEIASSYDVRLISIKNKPEAWTGKSWACQIGSESASGELLLFLDADVRLSPKALENLMKTYDQFGCVISVQPYHTIKKIHEQFSIFFNLIQVAANGLGLPWAHRNVGLYGPVILIHSAVYDSVGGHFSVKDSIVEDLALGEHLERSGNIYKLFVGSEHISFRMYGDGFGSLFQGFTKNIATGAKKTPFFLSVMTFFWITSCTSVPLHLVVFAIGHNFPLIILYSLLYFIWILILWRISRKIGNFSFIAIIFYPILLIAFLCVFAVSLFKKLFHIKVLWKNRKIELRD